MRNKQATHILTMDTIGGPPLATKGLVLDEFQYMDLGGHFRTQTSFNMYI